MATVRYEGGSCDGLTLPDVPDEFAAETERELIGDDQDQPVELYRRRGREADVVVYEFVSKAAQPTTPAEGRD